MDPKTQPIPLKQAERSVDFNIFSMGMEVIKKADPNDTRKRIRCIASSSIEDRHGDTITEACITGMRKQATGLSIFLNHNYSLPEDLFGFVESARTKRMTVAEARDKGIVPEHTLTGLGTHDVIAFLEIDVVLDGNERASKVLASVENGATIGVSIGAMILDYTEKEGHEDEWWPPLIINAVELLEASVVGIPANPLSWVEGATKAVAVSKGLLGKRASREDLDRLLSKSDPPSDLDDEEDDEEEDKPDDEEASDDAVEADMTPEPNERANSAASIVENFRVMYHAEGDEIDRPTVNEMRVLVKDELHDLRGTPPGDDEVQTILDAIVADQPLVEAVTK
jgi:hypothetical protein